MKTLTEVIRETTADLNEMKVLKKSDFGTVRAALSDANLYLGLLHDIAIGKMEVDTTSNRGAEWDKTAKKVLQSIKDVAKARNIMK